MSKPWRPHALHRLDAIAKITRIRSRGDLTQDEVLYDAALRNLQTLSEATRHLPERKTSLCPSISMARNQRLSQRAGAQLSGRHRPGNRARRH
jgi:uncharacterized protein with HEPN domain